MSPRHLELDADPAAPHPSQPRPLTLQLISSKESSKAVFQGDDWPPKPAGGTGYYKPLETERAVGAARAWAIGRLGGLWTEVCSDPEAALPGGWNGQSSGTRHWGPQAAAQHPWESDGRSP